MTVETDGVMVERCIVVAAIDPERCYLAADVRWNLIAVLGRLVLVRIMTGHTLHPLERVELHLRYGRLLVVLESLVGVCLYGAEHLIAVHE
jgi:hypothetical protein